MEALRLLSSGTAATALPGVAAEHHLLPGNEAGNPHQNALPSVSGETWDAALLQTELADLFPSSNSRYGSPPVDVSPRDTAAVTSGLVQLNKYLGRAWYRAGIPPQMHEDCTQAVYTTMLQQLGRNQFESLLSDVGHSGIKDVLSRETNEGVDFFRAVDMIKKRSLRERAFVSLDSVDVPAAAASSETKARSAALREAIDHSLSPREASLIQETLMGKTPAEIALHWGVAPKTVSNEKTRVLQKLRSVLLAQNLN
jgi:DNA-binding CsgD family transcriptional regulator